MAWRAVCEGSQHISIDTLRHDVFIFIEVLMYDFELLEKHQHKTNKLVRSTLRAVSRQLGIGYSDTLDFFRNGGEQVTIVFGNCFIKIHE